MSDDPVADRNVTGRAERSRATAAKLAELDDLMVRSQCPGTPRAIARQRSRGKKTARERIALLLDPGSFVELDAFARNHSTDLNVGDDVYGDGVVTGHGTVNGRLTAVFAQDFTVLGGTLGKVHGEKICKILDLAAKAGCPVVGINDGAGGRIQEGVVAQALYGEIFFRNVRMSGVVPQISIIMGPCAGGAAYSPSLTDFVVMVDKTSHMFVTGPDVLAVAMGERVGLEELGSARVHNSRSGNAHHLAVDEEDAIAYVRDLLAYLPASNNDLPPVYAAGKDPDGAVLDSVVPESVHTPYDMYVVVNAIVDDGDFLEVQPLFAPNIICALGSIGGYTVGIVANQPLKSAGCLDIDASEKAARFVRTCDAFNIPIVTLVDVPGFLPGSDQEWNGIIRRGAKLLYAYAEATVPKITTIIRKAYGGAYVVMGSKHLHADVCFAWPTAEIAVMGAEAASNILHRDHIAAAADPEGLRRRLITEYDQTHCTPYRAAERGYVDAVITPSETRRNIATALRIMNDKREPSPPKRHGNIPL
ncbi:acyl-CoA carboxylase subunit beta [Nocardia sp. NBC_00881]|uniref:acyl-CoA carboxylase subunit beta n=1 Tax=Nocardia sp. NBC_00881 TaxID=2975995 RepID=UPI003870B305|nr:acyl-CoA carboxylase subunit beta [Nocardia sp. NBC_00881]